LVKLVSIETITQESTGLALCERQSCPQFDFYESICLLGSSYKECPLEEIEDNSTE